MNILAVGDIVGKTGIDELKQKLPKIIEENHVDFVIVNGENAADGMGLWEKQYREILSLNVDCVTMGNHTWKKKDIFNFIDDAQIVRPANYPKNTPGKGCRIFEKNGKKIAVINLIGRVTMGELPEDPFLEVREIVNRVKNTVDIIIVDFHGEATAEKIAMGYYLDGDVTIVYGTHTHVQTGDEEILPKGTAYITDIGMTGPKHSVIGMDIDVSFKRFTTAFPEKYRMAEGPGKINSVMFTVNNETNKVTEIKRINM